MKIESGTTTEHRVRLGIFLAMCVVFAAYFGYDGLWGYPAKNLEWARQNINLPAEQKADLRTNPKVLMAALREVKPGMTEQEVEALLGEPAVVIEGQGLFAATDRWYVGPAAYAHIRFMGGVVDGAIEAHDNKEKSEADIGLQKILGVILGIVSIGVGIHYLRINLMRTVLDETGLTVKGRQIAWGQIKELDTSDYDRKGWLDVVYDGSGGSQRVRLDSYHIARFDEIIAAICERKDFVSPLKPKEPEAVEV